MKKNILSLLLAVAAIGLAIASYYLLPDSVIIQFSVGGGNTMAPKLVAILIPLALSLGGAVASFLSVGGNKPNEKCIAISAVGLVVFIIMLAVNA